MFEKEAEDFLKKSLKVDDDEFDFFKNETSCKEEIKRLTDFIEPREKRIEELEKEKCELLGIIQGKDEVIQDLKKKNAELKEKYVKECEDTMYVVTDYSKQLTKAKELIKEMLSILPKENIEGIYEITEKAEAFIREE